MMLAVMEKRYQSRREVTARNETGDEKIKFIIQIEEVRVSCCCDHWESWGVCYS